MRPIMRRPGYTLIELMVVLAVIIVLGAVVIPTIRSYYSNSHQKATADMMNGRIAQARALAMETGSWYRVSINTDKKRMRIGPDCMTYDSLQPGSSDAPNSMVVEDAFEDGVTAEVTSSDSSQASNSWMQMSSGGGGGSSGSGSTAPPASTSSEWVTVATVGPEGICREGVVTVTISEGKFQPLCIQVRGITASSTIIKGSDPRNNK